MGLAEKKIAVIGSNMVDALVKINRHAARGETLFADSFHLGFGGKGANQAVAAARLGANVLMLTKVGGDLFGPSTKKNLGDNGVDTTYVDIVPGVSSGVASIYVDQQAVNTMQVVKGANETLLPADIDRAANALKQCKLIILQLEIPFETVAYAIRFGATNNIPVIFNPAPTPEVQLDFNVVKLVEYFVPNENELAGLAGMPVTTIDEAKNAGRLLLKNGLKNIIVTLGGKGSLLLTKDKETLVEPLKVDSVDTTGAGDAFIGSFACFLLEGGDTVKAMQMANRYAAISTTRIGTQSSYLTRDEFMKTLS